MQSYAVPIPTVTDSKRHAGGRVMTQPQRPALHRRWIAESSSANSGILLLDGSLQKGPADST